VIFEAAGLAPSAFNGQPWKFLYARRGDANWQRFLDLLIPFNAGWAQNASVLIFIVSLTTVQRGDTVGPSHSHSFDAGAAWAQMALQATALGYHAHGMVGVDFDRARQELGVPDDWRIEAAVAIGRRDHPDRLSEALREREKPSGRKPVDEIAVAGNFR
jgi:nitroreductase